MNAIDRKKAEYIRAYEDYADAIYRFCLIKVRDKNLALDLSHDTFMKAWEYLMDGKEVEHIRGFLYQIARNLIIDYSRKKKTESLDALSELGIDFQDTSQSENNKDHLLIENALRVIDELDDKYKEVLIMRYTDELSVKEIAKILKEQENTISVRIHRALEKVREKMETKI